MSQDKAQRLRRALENKPQLLTELITSLYTERPRILGPWKTDLQVINARFVVQRHDIFGDPAIFLTTKSRKGNTGPWEARVTDLWRHGLPEQAWKPLNDIDLENPFGFGHALQRVDKALKDHSFTLAQHQFPEVILGPWKPIRDTYTRPIIKPDPLMPTDFKITVSQYDLGVGDPNKALWAWELQGGPEGYTRLLPRAGYHKREDAQDDADRYLITHGYNLARPTSYTTPTDFFPHGP